MKPSVKLPFPGPNARALFERDKAVLSTSNARGYPVMAERGEGSWVWDVDGNCFLDLMAGIAVNTTGYAHPKVVQAVTEQAARLQHLCFAVIPSEPQIALAERLSGKLGGGYRVFFGNSGTEGIEAAMKLARYHTRRPFFLAFSGSFHGRSMGALSLTASNSKYRKGFGNLVPGVSHLPYPNPYRHPDALERLRKSLDDLFQHTVPAEDVAAIFVEPIQGEGGYIVPPQGFLKLLREVCDEHGILLVLDEVQTGAGRTGRFLAAEHEGVKPDVVVMAKGLASGYPLSAVIFREEVSSWPSGAHGTTFGGNPVSVAAAHATLDLLDAGLTENAARVGEYLMGRLRALQPRFPRLGDVRGKGLMIGLEFVADPQTKTPDPALRDKVVQRCYEKGLLVLGAGPSAMRLAPPLILTQEEADTAVELFTQALEDVLEPTKA
ncbi:acetyl ornithine aminotransferase family protein [Calidithermus chliarophilus]|uniref:acetyl ornithine aminotransferase family protein n=1 Tax=Calidithermus chliarophilus TaxID=52023 RepID=UPI00040A5BC3|nr:acetyl ornithine aminotransferase family protein [Calidithermus chliarophilus]